MQNRQRQQNKKMGVLRLLPMTLVFVICILVANVWKAVQSADRVQDTAVLPSEVTTMTTQVSTQQAVVMGSDGSVTTPPPVTQPPQPTFQTVDASYFSDALFVGDSRSEGLALYGDLTNADYFTNVGMSIFQLNDVKAGNPNQGEQIPFSQKLAQKHYGKVYLMLGLNELGTGTADSWASAYAEVVAQVRTAQPDAIIYLQSILPVSAAKDDPNGAINNATVRVRNEALRALEDPAQHIYYLDVSQAVSDANGCLDASYTSDGIHLLGNSLYLWETYLEEPAIVLEDATSETMTTVISTNSTGSQAE